MSDGNEYARRPEDRNLPVPDPTRLTTQLVDRALAAYREVVETRLRAMDHATELLAVELTKITAGLREQRTGVRDEFEQAIIAMRESYTLQIKNVADVAWEKFAAINTRFEERDTRTEQAAQESRISLDAALAAAKEAVSEQNKANTLAIGKSEAATQKQIDALMAQMATSNKSLEDKIGDIKGRLDRGEGGAAMTMTNQTQSNWSTGVIISGTIAGIAVLLTAVTIVVAIVLHR